ncbi:MAG: hypothetical protein H6672_03955 [Anaerolineaceae bacterium]|nr:hypothetical protein [Anaerolineaceae bacterium]
MRLLKRYRWWLPLLMLVLAALACDPPYYDPIHVQGVRADPDTPGQALAQVGNVETGWTFYQTDDYGQTWHAAEQGFNGDDPNGVQLSMGYDETLMLNGRTLWTFPRQTYRYFFLDDQYSEYFKLPILSGIIEGSATEDTLYVPMGTEGVLVGPMPGTNSARQWVLTANGIDLLDLLPLTITDPATVALIVLLALAVPPLALIHAYLLSRVWVYLLPPKAARRYALITSFALAGLAAVAVVIWLTNIFTTYTDIVATITLIVVAVDLGVTHRLAQQQDITGKTHRRLLIAAGVLSLVVPAGVATIWWLWWAVFFLVFGFATFQETLNDYVFRASAEPPAYHQRWLIDRLALEMFLETLASGAVLLFLGYLMTLFVQMPEAILLLGVLLIILGAIPLSNYIAERTRKISDLPQPKENPKFWRTLAVALFGWVGGSVFASLATFIGQGWAYDWFTTLLK